MSRTRIIEFRLYPPRFYAFCVSFAFHLNRSFFQSVCVLGYCLAPVAGALIVCKVLLIAQQTKFVFFLRLVSTFVGFLWASYGKESFATHWSMIVQPTNFGLWCYHFSCVHIFGRQSTAQTKTTCCFPNCFILLHFIVACYIAFQHLKESKQPDQQWFQCVSSSCYYRLAEIKSTAEHSFLR